MIYFSEDELKCKCGCNIYNVAEELEKKIDKARKKAGIPFVVTSCCRCEKHNKEEGGSETSSHITDEYKPCEAIDISVDDSLTRSIILDALIAVGFTRIGIAKTFIHCDVDNTKAQHRIWLY